MRVDVQTVKALLTERALRTFVVTECRFCPNPDCDVVYFDAAGNVLGVGDVRVPVWQKRSFGDRMICYCFDENEAAIRSEIEQTVRLR